MECYFCQDDAFYNWWIFQFLYVVAVVYQVITWRNEDFFGEFGLERQNFLMCFLTLTEAWKKDILQKHFEM